MTMMPTSIAVMIVAAAMEVVILPDAVPPDENIKSKNEKNQKWQIIE